MFFFSASSPSSIGFFTCLPGSCITLKIKSCHSYHEYHLLGSEFLLMLENCTVSTRPSEISDCLTSLQYCPPTYTNHTMSTVWPHLCGTFGRLFHLAVMPTSPVVLHHVWNIPHIPGFARGRSSSTPLARHLTKRMNALCRHHIGAPRSNLSFLRSNPRSTISSSSRSFRIGALTSRTA